MHAIQSICHIVLRTAHNFDRGCPAIHESVAGSLLFCSHGFASEPRPSRRRLGVPDELIETAEVDERHALHGGARARSCDFDRPRARTAAEVSGLWSGVVCKRTSTEWRK